MIVRCLGRKMSDEQIRSAQVRSFLHSVYQVTVGRDYVVLAMSLFISSPVYGNACVLFVEDDAGRCMPIPSVLFEVVDPKSSAYWRANFKDDGAVSLWPEEFYAQYFHDDLSNGDPAAQVLFKSVLLRMKGELSN
jgi:hypothetical protein